MNQIAYITDAVARMAESFRAVMPLNHIGIAIANIMEVVAPLEAKKFEISGMVRRIMERDREFAEQMGWYLDTLKVSRESEDEPEPEPEPQRQFGFGQWTREAQGS